MLRYFKDPKCSAQKYLDISTKVRNLFERSKSDKLLDYKLYMSHVQEVSYLNIPFHAKF